MHNGIMVVIPVASGIPITTLCNVVLIGLISQVIIHRRHRIIMMEISWIKLRFNLSGNLSALQSDFES